MSWSTPTAARFALAGALAFAAVYAVSEWVDPVYPELRQRMALFQSRRSRVEAAAVGNSHGGTLDFAALGERGMHFTMAGQDAFEAVYLARVAAEAAPLRTVYFAASYGVLRSDHGVVGSTDLRARRRQLYLRAPGHGPMPGDRALWLGGLLSPVVRDDHWAGVAARPLLPARSVRLAPDGRRIAIPTPDLTGDSLVSYGRGVAAQHHALGRETMALAPGTPARAAAAIERLAGELGARRVTLVLFTPPYHRSYLSQQDSGVLAESRAALGAIAARNPNVVWLDYAGDARFVDRDDLFHNSDHLNARGGRAFSALLARCVRAEPHARAQESGCPLIRGRIASARRSAPSLPAQQRSTHSD